MIVSLHQFNSGPHLAAWPALRTLATASFADVGPAPPHSRPASRRYHHHTTCAAAQQLEAVGYAAAAAPAAACRLIQTGEVHIWWLDPAKAGGAEELQRCRELLTQEEVDECCTAEEAAVRRERLLARALVRTVLAGYLPDSAHPRSLLFERNSHGKPRLMWPSAAHDGRTLRFNLTHTASLIGLAVTVEGLVGLDVEGAERRTRSDPLRLARRRFSDAEIEDLEGCPDGDSRAARFLQLWTLKEAYVKALGRGISAPPGLRSFSFRLGSGGASSSWHSPQPGAQRDAPSSIDSPGAGEGRIEFCSMAGDPRCWEFALLQPAPGHMAAVCIERRRGSSRGAGQRGEQEPLQPVRLRQFDAAKLLEGGDGRPLEPRLLARGVHP